MEVTRFFSIEQVVAWSKEEDGDSRNEKGNHIVDPGLRLHIGIPNFVLSTKLL